MTKERRRSHRKLTCEFPARSVKLVLLLMAARFLAFGQVGNGSITGVVTDSSGAVVAGTTVEAKNTQTGVVFRAVSTNAGDYTITDLPVGIYALSVTATGFKAYTHTNLVLAATQVLREDITLQVGATSESVTVTTEASLLTTESAELSRNVTIEALDSLPLTGIGTVNATTSGYRNPYNSLLTLPGVSNYNTTSTFTVNGLVGGSYLTETMRVEGQEATSHLCGTLDCTNANQPSVDAVQEIAYQMSNYAPEYGQAGVVVINMTMKSGTNQLHGSGYDYFVNEDLAAGDPFSRSGGCIVGPTGEACSAVGGSGGKFRPRQRRNDFGASLGGPVFIPKIYDGHNKTFWFFNYEEFLQTTLNSFNDTVPTANYLQGNFSQISPNGNCSLCSQLGIQTTALGTPTVQLDPNGSQLFANEIFDPATRAVATSGTLAGQGYALPFPNNTIPLTRFDPVSVKLMSLMPTANTPSVVGNYGVTEPGYRFSPMVTAKIDHNLDAKDKISFYFAMLHTQNQIDPTQGSADGLPNTLTAARGTFVWTYSERLNYDRTLRPNLLLHLGAGYFHTSFNDDSPELSFNPQSTLGVSGFLNSQNFPTFAGLYNTTYGGMQNMGPGNQATSYDGHPTFNSNLTWAHGKHTFKAGGEVSLVQDWTRSFSLVSLNAGTGPTSEPFTPVSSFGSFSTGFGFASFLLGDYSAISQSAFTDAREGSKQWALFAQDSWKVTRKLTVDYGLRWDYNTPEHEEYGRLGQIDASLANANAGGRLGALQFASTCGCQFYKSGYPYALGPRLGVAYQINPKTVFRGGWGLTYQFVVNPAGGLVSSQGIYNLAANSPSYVPATYEFVNIETPGAIQSPAWPVTNPYQYPNLGSTSPAPTVPDAHENRPPRINQFSAGFQREITGSFVIEASYVGNRAVWIGGGSLGLLSQLSPQLLASYGLFPYAGTGPCSSGSGLCSSSTYNNEGDRALLSDSLSSSAVIQKLGHILPYSGFPTSSTLQSALYPYPQFGAVAITGSPTQNSKYDSLQIKATKRLSHNLQGGGAYTWAQGFTRATRQDFFNPASGRWALQQIPPQALNFNISYTVPKASFLPKYVNAVTKDWLLNWFANYQSGAFLTPPTSSVNPNYLTSEDVRVPGQPLYTPGVNINNQSTYNPYYTQVLNPAAWTPCPSNATCMAAGNLIKGFRAPRTPVENANIGRNFRIGERMNLQIRGEFVNILNRLIMPAPITTNPQSPVTKNSLGIQIAGFGVINTYLAPNTGYALPTGTNQPIMEPRQGTLIARFTF
ncbi:MAG TPA: TonB-dependent receptor [Bryobacteraceae bacterium]